MTTARRLAMALVLVLLVAAPGLAQGTTGTLEGHITDDQGLPLTSATVTAQQPATGFQWTVSRVEPKKPD